jgi:hypothetical protein
MMLLSRFWYAIVAVALAASLGFVYIAIHEHNRIRETDTYEIVNHDRDIVDWFLQLDARRRLDALGIVSVDSSDKTPSVVPLLVKANGQDKIDGATVRDPMKKRLAELATKMSQLVRDEGSGGKNPVMLFAVDAHGRVVGSANFDRLNLVKEDTFELGGFPVVYDAMHGWLRDDTWVLDNDTIYRVVARPVVAAQNAPPVGAVVALRRIDDSFAHLVADKTNAPVSFYVDPIGETGTVIVVGRDAPEKSGISWDGFTIDENVLVQDKFYNGDAGASSLKNEKDRSVVYSRMVGTAWDQGAGYAVARKVASINDPGALLGGATTEDKKAVPWILVVGVALLALLIGVGMTFVEHTLPLNKLGKEAEKMRKGDQDALPLAKLSGPYRKIGQDVNEGFERIIAKGGGTSRKAADLSQVLGEIPAAPQMSAFSFGLQEGAGASGPASSPGSNPGVNDLFPNLPPAGAAAPPPAPTSQPKPGAPVPSTPIAHGTPDEDDEATQVARIPDELMRAAQTGEQHAIDTADEMVQWRTTFDEFVATRQRLGESTQGLSFEKFQVQLKKNKEQLVKQYNCKRVKFTVYEKEGKAALKATPIKE